MRIPCQPVCRSTDLKIRGVQSGTYRPGTSVVLRLNSFGRAPVSDIFPSASER